MFSLAGTPEHVVAKQSIMLRSKKGIRQWDSLSRTIFILCI